MYPELPPSVVSLLTAICVHSPTDSSLPLAPATSGVSGAAAAAAGGAPAAQPLPSSVINKQPMTADAQYMQQQSHIFVFSTQLANKAYEAVVLQSQFPTIIAYHCSQPGTKKYLDVSYEHYIEPARDCPRRRWWLLDLRDVEGTVRVAANLTGHCLGQERNYFFGVGLLSDILELMSVVIISAHYYRKS